MGAGEEERRGGWVRYEGELGGSDGELWRAHANIKKKIRSGKIRKKVKKEIKKKIKEIKKKRKGVVDIPLSNPQCTSKRRRFTKRFSENGSSSARGAAPPNESEPELFWV